MRRGARGSMWPVLLLVGLLLPAGGGVAALQAQEEAQEAPVVEGPVGYPPALEVPIRQRALEDTAQVALREIEALARLEAAEAELDALRQRQEELAVLFGTVSDAEHVRPERILRVRDRVTQHNARLQDLRERLLERAEALRLIRAGWIERQRFWVAWGEASAGDPDLALVRTQHQQGVQRAGEVMTRAGEVISSVLELEREAIGLQNEAEGLVERLAAMRVERREALFTRTEPVLGSPAHLARLGDPELMAWSPEAAFSPSASAAFVRENGGLLFLHALILGLLALVAARLRGVALPSTAWAGLLRYPWVVALFGSTAMVAPRYSVGPALGDVIAWTVLAGSAALLTRELFHSRALRLSVYVYSVAYPLFLLMEALRTPQPVARIGLAVIAATALGLFVATLKRHRAAEPVVRWSLLAGALIWTIVLLAEIAGFSVLARWILHAAVTSAFVGFVVGFLVVTARGAIQTLLAIEFGDRLRFLRRVGVPLAERILQLVQVVLIVGAVLQILDIWELTPAPAETWRAFTNWGFAIADVRITVGRVLLAITVVYVAWLISWFLRNFAASEVYPRWELERGVGDSVSSLVHYTLLTAGILFGLGALGVHLQNFAIVVGALGVGIGFGLQNIVNNFVSGLILLFERPVRVGDTVVVGGEWGSIRKIGLRSTTVQTFDQSEMIVPNADLISEKVVNWTLTNPIARLVIPVGVAYGTEVARVLEILRECANVHPAVLDDPAPNSLFTGFGDSSLDFELRVWVGELRFRLEVQSAVLAEIDRRFRDADIEIPFPQRDLHVRSIDARLLRHLAGADGGVDGDGGKLRPE